MRLEDKGKQIIKDIKSETGPEHHILDGASILVAFHNAGGNLDLNKSLEKLFGEGLRMPGAMCGLWGVCGAITSIGASLAIIDSTGPLSDDGSWGEHMSFTVSAVKDLSEINGPRCCKRDAMLAFKHAVEYVNRHYGVTLEYEEQECEFSHLNQQCIKQRCPFYKKG